MIFEGVSFETCRIFGCVTITYKSTHFFCCIILLSLMYMRRKSQTTVVTPRRARPEPTFRMVFFRLNFPPRPSIVMMN